MADISIKDVLENIEKFKGWLYLKTPPWSLDSHGFFYSANLDLSPDEEKKIRNGLEAKGWRGFYQNKSLRRD